MISGGWDVGDHGVEPASCGEPLPPLGIPVGAVDEITGVEEKSSFGGIGMSFPDDSGPHGPDIILSITEIDEGEGFRFGGGRLEMEPFAEVFTNPDTVDIFGPGEQFGEIHCVIVSFVDVAFEKLSGGGQGFDLVTKERSILGESDLSCPLFDVCRCSPRDGLSCGSVSDPGEDDSIGDRSRFPGLGVGYLGGAMIVPFMGQYRGSDDEDR